MGDRSERRATTIKSCVINQEVFYYDACSQERDAYTEQEKASGSI